MTKDTGFEKEITVTLDAEEYPMQLTTLATKEIAGKVGGLDKLKEKLTDTGGNEAELIETVCWLIALLVNQPIMKYNRKNRDGQKQLFEAEDIALLTKPEDLTEFVEKVSEVINRDSIRNVPDGAPVEKN